MRSSTPGILVLVLTASCRDSCWTDDYSFERRGEDVTVYGYDRSEAEACGGSFDALERQTKTVMDFLDVDDTLHYIYRWMSDDFYRAGEFCSPVASACTVAGEPLTRALPDMHEVVHMVTYSLPNGGCPSVLDEGLAVYLDGPHPREYVAGDEVDIRELLTAQSIPQTWAAYSKAGHFVSFLVENYGREVIAKLCAGVPATASVGHWDAAMLHALGAGFDDVLAEYGAYPACGEQHYRARLWECDGEPDFTLSPASGELTVATGCDDPRAMQPLWQGYAVTHRRVRVTDDATVTVDVSSTGELDDVFFVSQECLPCSADPVVYSYDATQLDQEFIYRPGMHEIVVVFDPEETIQLRMTAVALSQTTD